MPKHADAVRDVFRRLPEHVFGCNRVGAHHFVRGDPDANFFVMPITAQRCDDYMFRVQAGPASFGDSDVDQRDDGSAQIKNAHHVARRQRKLGDDGPLEDFLHVEDRQTEPFASAAEDAILRFGRTLFENVVADEGYREVFNQAMSSYSAGETAMVLDALSATDFSSIESICDVGGGHGHLLGSLLASRPKLKGIVAELPATIAAKELLWADRLGVADRCRYVAGDMFKEVPAADTYLMKHILHDWNDEECVTIIRNCRRAARPGARIFIAEYVVTGPAVPHFGKLFDIHMMVALTGRERTEAEYAALLKDSGWRFVATRAPSVGPMRVVEGALA